MCRIIKMARLNAFAKKVSSENIAREVMPLCKLGEMNLTVRISYAWGSCTKKSNYTGTLSYSLVVICWWDDVDRDCANKIELQSLKCPAECLNTCILY